MSRHQKHSHSTRLHSRFTRTRVLRVESLILAGGPSPGAVYARQVLAGMTPAQLDGGMPGRGFTEELVQITARPVCGPTGRRFNPANLEP